MTRLSSHEGMTQEEIEQLEFEAELDGSADSILANIEDARSRMTASERKDADKKADAILKHATESAKLSRRHA